MCMKYNVRLLLAKNVTQLMQDSKASGTDLSSQEKLAARCKRLKGGSFSQRTIGYLLRPQDSVQPKLDTVLAVAEAFGKEPWQLLHPTMGERMQKAPELARRFEMANDKDKDIIQRILNMDPSVQTASDQEVSKHIKPAPSHQQTSRQKITPEEAAVEKAEIIMRANSEGARRGLALERNELLRLEAIDRVYNPNRPNRSTTTNCYKTLDGSTSCTTR